MILKKIDKSLKNLYLTLNITVKYVPFYVCISLISELHA